MAKTIWIDADTLIELLEGYYGNIYESIKENDTIEEIKVTPRSIKIIIGKE